MQLKRTISITIILMLCSFKFYGQSIEQSAKYYLPIVVTDTLRAVIKNYSKKDLQENIIIIVDINNTQKTIDRKIYSYLLRLVEIKNYRDTTIKEGYQRYILQRCNRYVCIDDSCSIFLPIIFSFEEIFTANSFFNGKIEDRTYQYYPDLFKIYVHGKNIVKTKRH